MPHLMAREPRSASATMAALFSFGVVVVGTSAILTLVVSFGPAVESAYRSAGIDPSLASRLALLLSRLVNLNYWQFLGVTAALHFFLFLYQMWAGRTPARLPWGVMATALLVSTQILVLLWLCIAFIRPFVW